MWRSGGVLKGGTVQVFLITNICSFQLGGSQLPGLTYLAAGGSVSSYKTRGGLHSVRTDRLIMPRRSRFRSDRATVGEFWCLCLRYDCGLAERSVALQTRDYLVGEGRLVAHGVILLFCTV